MLYIDSSLESLHVILKKGYFVLLVGEQDFARAKLTILQFTAIFSHLSTELNQKLVVGKPRLQITICCKLTRSQIDEKCYKLVNRLQNIPQ